MLPASRVLAASLLVGHAFGIVPLDADSFDDFALKQRTLVLFQSADASTSPDSLQMAAMVDETEKNLKDWEFQKLGFASVNVTASEHEHWAGRIGFMGAIYLSTALLAPHGCPLRNLTLVNCDLGPTVEGSKALAVALYANETLETLNISDNMIGAAGAEYITEALRVNKTLKKID